MWEAASSRPPPSAAWARAISPCAGPRAGWASRSFPPPAGTGPCALFGAMGYRGRLHPSEGVIEGPRMEHPLSVPPQESPAVHRLAKPGAAFKTVDGVEISEVEGRKFYYDGPLLEGRARPGEEGGPVREYVDAVPTKA